MHTQSDAIRVGATAIGIELGSTRIKAVLIDLDGEVLATGGFEWENRFTDGIWTYPLDLVWEGLSAAYLALASEVRRSYGLELTTTGSIGISAMMHGYLVFDSHGKQLVEFRTWRNSMTEIAAAQLTEQFAFNVPQRWCIAHLAHAILGGEDHVEDIAHMTTLAGLVHWKLTGRQVVGVGDASGIFPIDPATAQFDNAMLDRFDTAFGREARAWTIRDILPDVLAAGEEAGALTESGARLLDPSGSLRPGIPLAPPEGDGATGMIATNSIVPGSGNTSAGTSVFTMVVMERPLKAVHEAIDVINTPTGRPVAMVHCNNGANEINAWAGLFSEFASLIGSDVEMSTIFESLFRVSLDGDTDCGGLLSYNYLAGEVLTGFSEGRPLLVRPLASSFTLANFMRSQISGVFATLALGMRLLAREEIRVESMLAHGGLFTTKGVAQRLLAAALETPVSVGETAGYGGAWGMAILAAYASQGQGRPLHTYLDDVIFRGAAVDRIEPLPHEVAGFQAFLERYEHALPVMAAAVRTV